jgi:hypothetical protein
LVNGGFVPGMGPNVNDGNVVAPQPQPGSDGGPFGGGGTTGGGPGGSVGGGGGNGSGSNAPGGDDDDGVVLTSFGTDAGVAATPAVLVNALLCMLVAVAAAMR